MRALYDWTMEQATRPYALWMLALISFLESSVFPIPPDILLIPMILAHRQKAWLFAFVCTLASVAGGMAGYLIGWSLFDLIGKPILDFYGYLEKFESFSALYNEHGAWIVFGAGVTPFPYKVITIASGTTGLDFIVFSLASIAARSLRFFVLAALLWWWGEWIRAFIDRYFGLLSLLFFVLLIGGFVALKYL